MDLGNVSAKDKKKKLILIFYIFLIFNVGNTNLRRSKKKKFQYHVFLVAKTGIFPLSQIYLESIH